MLTESDFVEPGFASAEKKYGEHARRLNTVELRAQREAATALLDSTPCPKSETGRHVISTGGDFRRCWRCDLEMPWNDEQWEGYQRRLAEEHEV